MMNVENGMLLMANIGLIGYGIAAVFFLFFTLLLLTSWRGRMQGGLLVLVGFISMIWAGASALQAGFRLVPSHFLWSLEAIRLLVILVFLIRILDSQAEGNYSRKRNLRRLVYITAGACSLLLLPFGQFIAKLDFFRFSDVPDLRLLIQVIFSVVGLVLVEQVYRNTPWEYRWGIKYLCLGIGTLLAFDFYFYSDALLFNHLDADIWQARGAVNAIAVPLLAVSAARNPQWSLDLFVSRKFVFHTTSIFAAGIYLLLMALTGYYIRLYGGEWSRVLELVFFVGAGLVLLVLLFSGQLRSRLKVFISKHFFSYKYDYREEWLRLIKILSSKDGLSAPLEQRVIFALSEIVDSSGGALWLRTEDGQLKHRAHWNLSLESVSLDWNPESLLTYLDDTEWVVNLEEYAEDTDYYEGLVLPVWLYESRNFWLIVPLFHEDELRGFILLAKPRAPQKLDWETLDLLKTAGRQAASYLALDEAANALAEARQFEGFNRLSAFVMHDLKNLIAQLSLVAKNAERHKHNPEFIDDAIMTIQNSVGKMNHLMAQLRSEIPKKRSDQVNVKAVLKQITAERSAQLPAPDIRGMPDDNLYVYADRNRLGSVIGHIIQNAQEATGAKGQVEVRIKPAGSELLIEIEDDGPGMDKEFIENRLFKPFDSTKGLTGMGIGAYECREFVTSLGGRVRVDSTPGKGTLFLIFVPMASVDEAAEELH